MLDGAAVLVAPEAGFSSSQGPDSSSARRVRAPRSRKTARRSMKMAPQTELVEARSRLARASYWEAPTSASCGRGLRGPSRGR